MPSIIQSSLPNGLSPVAGHKGSVSSGGLKDNQYGKYHPRDLRTLDLESNFGPMDPDAIGYLQPTSANTSIETMRARFKIDGYLYVGSVS
ncbi:putative Phytanoyl-CoA hydroxylase [Seiridium unicorne]|uniref:Phytanoyl-CoA hydroxylase n=1 Tax=Seiridium unicorne TaxID=138068 RepID=A0ABR2UYY3_9PEZI